MYDDDNSTNSRQTPNLANGITGPVVVPLLQALVTGLLIGICAVVLFGIIKPDGPKLAAFLITWTLSTLVSWINYRSRWQWVIERVLGVDITGDGVIGEPAAQPYQPLRIIVDEDQGRAVDYIDLPYPDRIPQLAAGLVEGRIFKAETFNHIFSRPEFERIRDEMIRRELARWKNERAHAQGAELTAKGRAVMRGIADKYRYPPTLPPGN